MSNRRSQNQAYKEWQALTDLWPDLYKLILPILARYSEESGQRRHLSIVVNREDGTPPPSYSDPTGETAIRGQINDSIYQDIRAFIDHIHHALNIARKIKAVTPADVAERAQREVPDCLACGDPCVGRIIAGFDEKCYKRWTRHGRSDRSQFVAMVRRERIAIVSTNSTSDEV